MFPLGYMADAEAARGVKEVYEFRIDGETFHLRVEDGAVEPRAGAADRPDLVVGMDEDTMIDLFFGDLDPTRALEQRRVEVEGPREALGRAMAILA